MSLPNPRTAFRRRVATLAAGVSLVALAAACTPPSTGGPSGLYLDQMPNIDPVVASTPVTWGWAPNIDPNYGGLLYASSGTPLQDPRPALDADGNQPLRMWVADPNDGRTNRPAIIWLHGGGFAFGLNAMPQLANTSGADYAKRGYVGFAVEYRMNTTVIGNTNRPPSLCQWVQDNKDVNDPLWLSRFDTCRNNITAATRDALAAVRYLRANAATYGIDPNRIAVAGFSAGAVTAVGTAYRSDDPGAVSYFPGDDPTANSQPQAVFGASGCLAPYDPTGAIPEIGSGDSPISTIQARYDQALDYSCAANTVLAARSQGLVAEMTSYCASNLHAQNLYDPNKAVTDKQWTTFLARWLNLRSDVRGPSADPTCTN